MMKSVIVSLDRFGHEALEEYLRGTGESRADALDVAVRYYLTDSDSGRVTWRVPSRPTTAAVAEPLELELADDLHERLMRESRRQQVSVDVLAMHALLYYLADLDSGRVAARLGDAMNRDAEAK
jgi:hypothetical protein